MEDTMRHHSLTAMLRLVGSATLLAIVSTGAAQADHTPSTHGAICTDSALRLDGTDIAWSQRGVRGGGGGRAAVGRAGGGRASVGRASVARGSVARGAGPGRRPVAGRPNVNRNTNVNVRRTNVNVVARPVRAWGARPYYGTIVGGVALGTVIAVAAANAAPAAPAPGLCWYWSDSSRTRGYWDYC
jgi:hypothetical protein